MVMSTIVRSSYMTLINKELRAQYWNLILVLPSHTQAHNRNEALDLS